MYISNSNIVWILECSCLYIWHEDLRTALHLEWGIMVAPNPGTGGGMDGGREGGKEAQTTGYKVLQIECEEQTPKEKTDEFLESYRMLK